MRDSLAAASPRQGWFASCIATVASTYALDAVAAMAGMALLASGLLADLSRPGVLLLLAGSYGLWAVALSANVRANWLLLKHAGLSTSVVSKAAYELARLKTRLTMAHKTAAAAGYVAVELAKEMPYYLGAFGAAMLSDAVSANDALVFLVGTNIGAALYEGLIATASRLFLRRRRRSPVPDKDASTSA